MFQLLVLLNMLKSANEISSHTPLCKVVGASNDADIYYVKGSRKIAKFQSERAHWSEMI